MGRCQSGRLGSPAKWVLGLTQPRVRIPPSPPIDKLLMHGARAKGVCQLESKLLQQFALFYFTWLWLCVPTRTGLVGMGMCKPEWSGWVYYTRFVRRYLKIASIPFPQFFGVLLPSNKWNKLLQNTNTLMEICFIIDWGKNSLLLKLPNLILGQKNWFVNYRCLILLFQFVVNLPFTFSLVWME